MTDPSFVMRGGDLEVSGETSWRGPVDGLPVRDVLRTSDGAGAIVLLEVPGGPGQWSNLVRVEVDGRVSWRATPPSDTAGADSFVAIGRDESPHVVAWTWQCYRVHVDEVDGHVVDRIFTK